MFRSITGLFSKKLTPRELDLSQAIQNQDIEKIRGLNPSFEEIAASSQFGLLKNVKNEKQEVLDFIYQLACQRFSETANKTDLLKWAIRCNQSIEVLQELYQQGAEVNSINAGNHCPINVAASAGRVEHIQFLHEKGVDVNPFKGFWKRNYFSPLHYAVMYEHHEAAETLLHLGVEVNHGYKFNCPAPLYFARDHAMAALLVRHKARKPEDYDSYCDYIPNLENIKEQRLMRAKRDLENYIGKRSKQPEYKMTLFGKNYGYSKQEKLQAANQLLNTLRHKEDTKDLKDGLPALTQGDLGSIYQRI